MKQTNHIKSNSLIPYQLKELLKHVTGNKQLSVQDALAYIMNSNLYTKLHDEEAKYWYLSSEALYAELEQEKINTRNKVEDKLLLFIAFCIENYQAIKKISKEEVLFLFAKYDVIQYLEEVYEPLHTQGLHYILDEIEAFIKSNTK